MRTWALGNYLVRHWRGELPLPVAFWVNGVMLSGGAVLLLTAAVRAMGPDLFTLKAVALGSLALMLFAVSAAVWSLVGVWRAAVRFRTRGGAQLRTLLAKAAVVAGFAVLAVYIRTFALQAAVYVQIALGNDPVGPVEVGVTADGKALTLRGALREGTADQVLAALAASPRVTSLMLNSGGGRLFEAEKIAAAVRARKLDTYVEYRCDSACTYIFLSGRDRAATPNAKIGFHQPSFPEVDDAAQRLMTQQMLDVYRRASLPEPFIQRIASTPPQSMWYPTRDELIAARVVTRMSLGGETTATFNSIHTRQEMQQVLGNSPLTGAYEKRFPGALQKAVDAAWQIKTRGGRDAEIYNATRAVTAQYNAKLVLQADDAAIESYARLALDQLQAARRVGAAACGSLMKGELDITRSLPAALHQREQAWLAQTLAAPPVPARQQDGRAAQQALQTALASLPPVLAEAVSSPARYRDRSELLCDAHIAFYQAVLALPPAQRTAALTGMSGG